MVHTSRAVRRAELRASGRARRMPLLAAATVVALVALSAQGAAVASADELADPTNASEASGPADASDPTNATEAPGPAEAADPTDAVEAPGPADASDPTQATEAPGPADAADPTQATEAPDPSDATEAPGPADASDPTNAAEAPGPVDPADATEPAAPADGSPADVPGVFAEPAALVNTPPVGAADHYSVAADWVLTIAAPGVLANDGDADGDILRTETSTTGTAQGGHVSLHWDGSFSYTPAAGFVGTDTWNYRPSDGQVTSAAAVEVTFTVVDTHDAAPVAQDDSYATAADSALVIGDPGVLGNDSDSDGNLISVVPELTQAGALATANGGTVDWAPGGGFTYLPAVGFVGYDTVDYRITDGVLDSDFATVAIKVGDWANTPPIAVDDHYATAANHLLSVDAANGLLANDSDATDPLTVLVPAMLDTGRAAVTLHSDGSFTYSSHAYDTVGPDTFTYQVTDGSYNLPVTATVTIDVAPFTNANPVAADDHYTTPKNTGMGVGAATGLLANDSDPDLDPIAIQFAQPDAPTEAGGIVNIGVNGSFSYTPPTGFVGVDGFGYNVVDVFGGQAIAIATITVTDPDAVGNTMPVATDDHYSTAPDTILVVSGSNGMLLNDFDADGDPLHSIIPALPYGSASVQGGTVTGTPDGGFSYTPPAGFVGEDEFVYHVMDESVESYDIGTVRVTVAAAVPATDAGGTDGAGGAGDGSTGSTDPAEGADAASAAHDDPATLGENEGALASTGAAPDATLSLSLLLLLTGAAGIVVAALAHRRSRRS